MDAMSRKRAWMRAYAIVRMDEGDVSVKEVVMSISVGLRELERLNALNGDKGAVYEIQPTHLFLDGGSHGSTPES